jgi:DsbC/DsbD-like thiol-disulfide interchange protein
MRRFAWFVKKTKASFQYLFLGILVLGLIVGSSSAQSATVSSKYLSVRVPDTAQVSTSETNALSLTITLDSKWHINTGDPKLDFLIPTRLKTDTPLKMVSVDYPSGKPFSFAFSDRTLQVYKDTVTIGANLRATEIPTSRTVRRRISISYQPCSRTQCLPPEELDIPVRVTVSPEGDRLLLDFAS